MRDAYLQRRNNLVADGVETNKTMNDGFEPAEEDKALEPLPAEK